MFLLSVDDATTLHAHNSNVALASQRRHVRVCVYVCTRTHLCQSRRTKKASTQDYCGSVIYKQPLQACANSIKRDATTMQIWAGQLNHERARRTDGQMTPLCGFEININNSFILLITITRFCISTSSSRRKWQVCTRLNHTPPPPKLYQALRPQRQTTGVQIQVQGHKCYMYLYLAASTWRLLIVK